jgi:ABC-type lipoprotein export system ATPase subunit
VNNTRTDDVVVLTDVVRHFTTAAETIKAVDGVSMSLRRGELAVLAGRSGSGKSTLLYLLLGWDKPDSGSVENHANAAAGWAGQAVVPQGLGLLPELSARQNIEIAGRLAGTASSADELIERFELVEVQARRPDQLSLGEQQRVAIARALSCAPALLVADEPTAHQDEPRAAVIMDAFHELGAQGSAVLVASHDDVALASGARRFDLDDGRLR